MWLFLNLFDNKTSRLNAFLLFAKISYYAKRNIFSHWNYFLSINIEIIPDKNVYYH